MFRTMLRKKQQLSQEECIQVLKNERRGVLSVHGENGYPYGMPMNHWYCETDGKLYFHSGQAGHKIDAMKANNQASFCVFDSGFLKEGDWALNIKSVIVFGRVEFVKDQDRALAVSRELSYKFTDDETYIEDEIRHAGHRVLVFALVPEHMSGKLVNEN